MEFPIAYADNFVEVKVKNSIDILTAIGTFNSYDLGVILPTGKKVSSELMKFEISKFFAEYPELKNMEYLLVPYIDHENKIVYSRMMPIPETA